MKNKYDWWGAACYVMDRTFVGFLASFFLVITLITFGLVALGLLAKSFGFLGVAVVVGVISFLIVVGLTAREIKTRGWRYEKH